MAIETHIFNTGDITEVKAWLDENATDIFDTIEISDTDIVCTKDSTELATFGFNSNGACVIKLASGQSFSARGYQQSHFTMAYRTTTGIWLFNIGSSYTVSVMVTQTGEVYASNGYANTRQTGKINSPNFTEVPTPNSFAITTLCPTPFTSAEVSEDTLLTMWTQLVIPGAKANAQIIEVNGVNYVYDGFFCLRE